MKVSEMINNLKEFMENYGDFDCYYATDDEGNGYREVYYDPSMYYINSYGDVYQLEDLDETDEEEREDLHPICIVN